MKKPRLNDFERETYDGQDLSEWYKDYYQALERYVEFLEQCRRYDVTERLEDREQNPLKTLVSGRFNEEELSNILRKVKVAKIKPNFKDVLIKHFGAIEYDGDKSNTFFEKYAGKIVNVYEWAGDWWICEDDNFVITKDCFDVIKDH